MSTPEDLKKLEKYAELVELRKEENQRISEAKAMADLFKEKSFLLFTEKIEKEIEKFQYQDILGIKDNDTLKEHKGIVIGLKTVLSIIEDIKLLAKRPKIDEETGEPIKE